jgi:hypothetical protein
LASVPRAALLNVADPRDNAGDPVPELVEHALRDLGELEGIARRQSGRRNVIPLDELLLQLAESLHTTMALEAAEVWTGEPLPEWWFSVTSRSSHADHTGSYTGSM